MSYSFSGRKMVKILTSMTLGSLLRKLMVAALFTFSVWRVVMKVTTDALWRMHLKCVESLHLRLNLEFVSQYFFAGDLLSKVFFSSKVVFSVTANLYTADTHSEPWNVSLQNILHYIIEYSNFYDNIFKSKWPADLVIHLSWEKCWSVTVCYCVHAFVLCMQGQ